MISEGEKQHVAVQKLSALFREITSKNNAEFCCLDGFYSFRTKNY